MTKEGKTITTKIATQTRGGSRGCVNKLGNDKHNERNNRSRATITETVFQHRDTREKIQGKENI